MAKAGVYKVASSMLTIRDEGGNKRRFRRGANVELNQQQATRFTIEGTRGPAVIPADQSATSDVKSGGASATGEKGKAADSSKEDK